MWLRVRGAKLSMFTKAVKVGAVQSGDLLQISMRWLPISGGPMPFEDCQLAAAFPTPFPGKQRPRFERSTLV